MLKNLILSLSIILSSSFCYSIDLIVDQTGAGGAYITISEALTAAGNGDRVLVYPGLNAFFEDLTIDKPIQLLCAVEGNYFRLNGEINIDSDFISNGDEIIISGADILNGNIETLVAAPLSGATITIVGCVLRLGNVVTSTRWNAIIEADSLFEGYIEIRAGRVAGNFIDSKSTGHPAIEINGNGLNADEYLYVVGNHIIGSDYPFSSPTHCISWASSSYFAYIANNYIQFNNGNVQNGINISNVRSSAEIKNRVFNNSIIGDLIGISFGIFISSPADNSVTLIENNLIQGDLEGGIRAGGPDVNYNWHVNFNHIEITGDPMSANIPDTETNSFSGTYTIDPTTGQLLSGPGIDGGNPDLIHTDLDLTQNDAGCYGGSYSMANFKTPIGSARTTFMIAPRRAQIGELINIQGEGFDR